MITQEFDINIVPHGLPPRVEVDQYDTGLRTLIAHIYQDDTPLVMTDEYTYTVIGTKPSGTGFSYPATAENGAIVIDVTGQMTVVSGLVECGIIVWSGTDRVGTHRFNLWVQPSALPAETIIDSDDFGDMVADAAYAWMDEHVAGLAGLWVNNTVTPVWEQGTINNNGGNTANTARLRSDFIRIPSTIPVDISITQGVREGRIAVFRYASNTTSSFIEKFTYYREDFTMSFTDGDYIRFVFYPDDQSTVTPDDNPVTVTVTTYEWTDTSLTRSQKAADAQAVGDILLPVAKIVNNSPNYLAPLMLGRDTPFAQFVITSSVATLTLPQDTFIMLRTGVYKHIAPAGGGSLTIDLLDITPATTAVQVAYNIDTDSIVLKRFNTALSDAEYVFCVLRRNGENSSISITCPYMLNGKMYGIDYEEYENPYVKGVNHRGYTTAPENTLPAFRLSRQMGFSYVECDVTLTSDDVPVILHDATINRTARNADGTELSSTVNIADITYAQALTYDFGIYKSSAYAGTTIPTFEEFLALCRNLGLHPYIEIKSSTRYTEAKVQGLVDTVRRYGMADGVTWISTVLEYLEYVRDYASDARLGYIVSTISAAALTATQSLKTASNYVSIDARITNLTDALVQSCIDANVPLEVWTVDDAATILSMSPYITGVTSNSLIAGKVLYSNSI